MVKREIFQNSFVLHRITGKQVAFTLAEVLITLGIIGVVAAMTIPTIVKKYNEKITVTKVKKMHSILSQAYIMYKAQNETGLGSASRVDPNVTPVEVAQIFLPYLKVAKDCGTTGTECINAGMYKRRDMVNNYVNYDADTPSGSHFNRVLLSDGSTMLFNRTNNYIQIFYDVNGNKEPNAFGRDLFFFLLHDGIVTPAGDGYVYDFSSSCANQSSTGTACTAWIIRHGNMEYLNCDGLQLNGPKTKCN